jgi:hypothetical protein
MRSASSSDGIKSRIRTQVRGIVTARTGPSFEERVNAAAKVFREKAAETQKEQEKAIAAAVNKGRSKPPEAPVRSRKDAPESIESRAERGLKEVTKATRAHWAEVAKLKDKMANREPLFRLEAVAAAVKELKERQEARRLELEEDERQRWEFIGSLKERVLERPLVLESFEREPLKPVDLRRMATPAPVPVGIEKKIQNATSKSSFKDSDWAKQVEVIRARQDSRPKLHEIKYTPVHLKPPPPRPRELGPIEKQIVASVNKPWFKNGDWNTAVQGMKDRQNERTKLHEMTYPKKWEEPPPVNEPSAYILKIQAANAEKNEAKRVAMAADERKQRANLRAAKETALLKRDRSLIGFAA